MHLQHQVLDDDNCSTISSIFSGHDPLALSFGQDEFSQFTGYTVETSADNHLDSTFVDVKSYWEADDELFRIISDMGSNYPNNTLSYSSAKEFSTSPTTPKKLPQTLPRNERRKSQSTRSNAPDPKPTSSEDIFAAPVSLISYELGEGLFDEAKFFSSPDSSFATPPRVVISRPREESPTPNDEVIYVNEERFFKPPKTPETPQSDFSPLHGGNISVPRSTESPPAVKRLHNVDLYSSPRALLTKEKNLVTPTSKESQSTTPTCKTTPTSYDSSYSQRKEPTPQEVLPKTSQPRSEAAVTCVQIIRPNHEDEIQLVFNELEEHETNVKASAAEILPNDVEKYSDPGLTPLASISFEEEIPGVDDAEWWKNAFHYNVAPLDQLDHTDSQIQKKVSMDRGSVDTKKQASESETKVGPRPVNFDKSPFSSDDDRKPQPLSKKVHWSLPKKTFCTALDNVDGLFEAPKDIDEITFRSVSLQEYSTAQLLSCLNKNVPETRPSPNYTPKSCMKPPSPVRVEFKIPGEDQVKVLAPHRYQSPSPKPYDETDSDEDDIGLNALSLDGKEKAMSVYQRKYENNNHSPADTKSQTVLTRTPRESLIKTSTQKKNSPRVRFHAQDHRGNAQHEQTADEDVLAGPPRNCANINITRNSGKADITGLNGDNWWISSCQPQEDELTMGQSYDETLTYDESAKDTIVTEQNNNWMCAFEEEEIDFTTKEDLGESAWKASGLADETDIKDNGTLGALACTDRRLSCVEDEDDRLATCNVEKDLKTSERPKWGRSCGGDEDDLSLDDQSRDNEWRLSCEGRDDGYFTLHAVTDDSSFDTQMMEESGI